LCYKKMMLLFKSKLNSFFQLSLSSLPNTKMKESSPFSSYNLFPYDDILTKEIESWKSYADCIRKQDRELFYEMLNRSYKYSPAITTKGKEHSTTSVLMSILLEHHKHLLSK
jgi:hypothetical protein